jgi:hypothetical protein
MTSIPQGTFRDFGTRIEKWEGNNKNEHDDEHEINTLSNNALV